jgi:hypothetical protein
MMPQLPTEITASGHQPIAQMTIAFLLDGYDNTESIDHEATRNYCDSASTPAQVPVAHPSPWIPPCDQTKLAKAMFDTSSSQTGFPHYSSGQYPPQARSLESVSDTVSLSSGRASSSGKESCGYYSSNPSSDLATVFYKPSSNAGDPDPHHHHCYYNYTTRICKSTEASTRQPRSARPSYNEEQKFFIMHHRIVQKLSWPEIEDEFARFFKIRSKDGLTSVYYRIRKSWGMEQVLRNQAGCEDDLGVIEKKADHFSRVFLENIGYFDRAE